MYLYHGSTVKVDILLPHNLHSDPDLGGNKYVFATPHIDYALCFTGKNKWTDRDINMTTIRGGNGRHIIQLTELRPNAFSDVFDGEGYLYTVKADLFKPLRSKNNNWELVSDQETPYLILRVIDNTLSLLSSKSNIQLNYYDPQSAYFYYAIESLVRRFKSFRMDIGKRYLWWRFKKEGKVEIPSEVKKLFFKLLLNKGDSIGEA